MIQMEKQTLMLHDFELASFRETVVEQTSSLIQPLFTETETKWLQMI